MNNMNNMTGILNNLGLGVGQYADRRSFPGNVAPGMQMDPVNSSSRAPAGPSGPSSAGMIGGEDGSSALASGGLLAMLMGGGATPEAGQIAEKIGMLQPEGVNMANVVPPNPAMQQMAAGALRDPNSTGFNSLLEFLNNFRR